MQKESLRKKIDKLNQESKEILSDKDLSQKTRLFIKSLLLTLKVVVVVLLEKKTRRTSSNSGLPPSLQFGSNGNRNKSQPEAKKDMGSFVENSKIEIKKKTLSPKKCRGCGSDLEKSKVTHREKRESLDIKYTVEKKIFIAETKRCLKCDEKTKAEFPEDMKARFQYGIGIKSSIVNFSMIQMMSLQRMGEHFKGLTGKFISESTMLKHVASLGKILKKAWEEKTKKELLKAPVLYVDETSMRVKKTNHWIHTCSYKEMVLQILHPKRGVEGIKSMGILDRYGGIIVHDCWSSYLSFKNLRHGLCNAHLIRELKFIEDSTKCRWATNMKRLLKVAVRMVNTREEKVLTKKEREKLGKIYEKILAKALFEMPEFPLPTGKRGRLKHTEAQNLWRRLDDYKDSVLLFTKVAEVEATNNRAERDLRMNKVKKKVSGCFRSEEMAQHFCLIYSYVKTMRNKGFSSLQAITLAFKGQIPN